MFFPEGKDVSQPLGGELCMISSLAQYLIDYPMAPPHTWGIDTFITVTSLVGGFKIAELYLSQKLHKGKTIDELKEMLLECFDEMAKLIHYHGRDKAIPHFEKSGIITIPRSESGIRRIGPDVRTLAYTDLDSEISSFFKFIAYRKIDLKLLDELGLQKEDQNLISRLLDPYANFREVSRSLDAKRWIHLLNDLVRGYIRRQFSRKYHDIIYAIWRTRVLAFWFNEASSFMDAEENTQKQAEYAFEFTQTRFAKRAKI